MKKGLLGSTALIGATALMAGAAGAAEAPTWKLSGNMNFQVYNIDQDWVLTDTSDGDPSYAAPGATPDLQDHGWYFGVDEAELQLNVSGTADNGLNYGFKVEIQTNTDDGTVADEARLQLSGGWGTIQMGDEDGAEDIMNYGGETVMGATGGFDGDWWDTQYYNVSGAPSGPTITGDTSDATKISYFSPRFSGFQVGASLTPTPNSGNAESIDGSWENNIGLGANYDNSFGGVRVRASAVYAMASSTDATVEDTGAWSVGGVVGFGPVSVGANYADNSDSGQDLVDDIETSYWDVAASFETGPMYFSVGYFAGLQEETGVADAEFSDIALTADYSVAPGLGVYAEVDLLSSEQGTVSNDGTVIIAGANVSF
jgi:outer membrane protein OmpU